MVKTDWRGKCAQGKKLANIRIIVMIYKLIPKTDGITDPAVMNFNSIPVFLLVDAADVI